MAEEILKFLEVEKKRQYCAAQAYSTGKKGGEEREVGQGRGRRARGR